MISPEQLVADKVEAIAALRAEPAGRPERFEHEALAQLLRLDDERLARGESPAIHELARDWAESFRASRTPQERAAARLEAQDAELAREQAATRWRTWIADSDNVDRLIAMVEAGPSSAPVAPSQSKIPPWLRRG